MGAKRNPPLLPSLVFAFTAVNLPGKGTDMKTGIGHSGHSCPGISGRIADAQKL